MTKRELKWLGTGAGLGIVLISLLAAVPSQTDFDPAYFRTNALPITLVGTLTNWAKLSTNSASGPATWTNFPSLLSPQGIQGVGITPFQIYTNGNMQVGTGASNFFGGSYKGLLYSRLLDASLDSGAVDNNGFFEIWIHSNDTNSGNSEVDIYSDNNNNNLSQTYDSGSGISGRFQVNGSGGSENLVLSGTLSALVVNNLADGRAYLQMYDSASHTIIISQQGYTFPLSPGAANHTVWYDQGVNTLMNLDTNGVLSATGGFSSLATDAFLTFTATGKTNSLGKVAVARFDGTTLTYVVKNNANTPVYTNTVSVGHATEIVQAGGAIVITAGSASGTMSPF